MCTAQLDADDERGAFGEKQSGDAVQCQSEYSQLELQAILGVVSEVTTSELTPGLQCFRLISEFDNR